MYGQAIEWFTRYAALSPGDANPFDSMGEICLRMGRLEQSLSYYQKAVDVKPDFWQSYLSLAYVNALQERYDRTFDNLQKMIDASGHATIRLQGEYWRGWFQSWLGQPAAAVRTLNAVLADTAARGDQFITLGCELARASIEDDVGAHDRARKRLLPLWERARIGAMYPVSTDIRFHTQLGLFDVGQGRLDSARTRLGLISALMPKVEPRFSIDAAGRFRLLEGELLIAEDSLDRAIVVLRSIPITPPPGSTTPVYAMYNIPFMNDGSGAGVRTKEGDGQCNRRIQASSHDRLHGPGPASDSSPVPFPSCTPVRAERRGGAGGLRVPEVSRTLEECRGRPAGAPGGPRKACCTSKQRALSVIGLHGGANADFRETGSSLQYGPPEIVGTCTGLPRAGLCPALRTRSEDHHVWHS